MCRGLGRSTYPASHATTDFVHPRCAEKTPPFRSRSSARGVSRQTQRAAATGLVHPCRYICLPRRTYHVSGEGLPQVIIWFEIRKTARRDCADFPRDCAMWPQGIIWLNSSRSSLPPPGVARTTIVFLPASGPGPTSDRQPIHYRYGSTRRQEIGFRSFVAAS